MAESRLVVKLVAENAKLHRELDRSNKKLRKFSGAAKKHAGLVKKALAGIGVGLVVRQFVLLAKAAIDAGDALAKTSEKLGIATEQLAGLRLAAKITGVEARTLDMALQRMTRRLAEAANGTGEAKAALKELGLDAVKLSQQSPDVAFREISAAMAQVTDQSQKVRLSFKLFDSEGVALVNTLKLGEEGLKAMQEQAEYFGTAISSETAGKMEDFNDSLALMNEALMGAANTIVEFAGPAMTEFIRTVAFGTPVFVNEFAGGVMTINMSLKEFAAGLYKSGAAFNGFMAKFSITKTARDKYLATQREMAKQELALRLEISETAGALVDVSEKVEGLYTQWDKFKLINKDDGGANEIGAMGSFIFGDDDTWEKKAKDRLDSVAKNMSMVDDLTLKHTKKSQTLEQKQWESGWKGKTQILSQSMSAIGGLMMQGSKKQFEIGKKLNIAAAIANTAQAITSALATPPFPLGLALATTAAATGLAQINAIRGTTFGGGGSVSTVSGGFITSSPSYIAPLSNPEPQSQTPAVTFNINALDTQNAADVIRANRGTITNIIQNSYTQRGAAGGPLG